MPERLRIVIADDNYLIREGTRRLLEESGGIVVLAAVGSAPELIDAVDRTRPDAVLTDIRMPVGRPRDAAGPAMEGIDAAHRIRAAHPGTGVVVFSQYNDEAYAFELFRDGMDGLAYLLKERIGDLDRVLVALRQVSAGESFVDPDVVDALIRRRNRVTETPLARLSDREFAVLRAMARGHGNRRIAAELELSESTVEKYVNTIFTKLGLSEHSLHRRVAAVLTYLRDSALRS